VLSFLGSASKPSAIELVSASSLPLSELTAAPELQP